MNVPTLDFKGLADRFDRESRPNQNGIRSPHLILHISLLALSYWATGYLGLLTIESNQPASAVFPPAGIALAALILGGTRLWPGVFLGTLLLICPLFLSPGTHPILSTLSNSLVLAIGTTLQALIAAGLLGTLIPNPIKITESSRNAFGFLSTVAVTSMISATIGSSSLALHQMASPLLFRETWTTWWLGDLVGILIFTPLILSGKKLFLTRFTPAKTLELALLFLVTTLATWLIFLGDTASEQYVIAYVAIILVLWAAFRFPPPYVHLLICLISFIAIFATVQGEGPFILQNHSIHHNPLLLIQGFMGIISVLGLMLNGALSDRNRVIEELSQFKFINDYSTDSKFLCDSRGHFVYVNKVACEVLGYTETELLRMSVWDVDPNYTEASTLETHQDILNGSRMVVQTTHLTKSGKLIPVEVLVSPYRLNGEYFFFGTARDVTHRLETEQKLKNANWELNQFATVASHDLRAPLRLISNYLQLLSDRARDRLDSESRSYISISIENAKRLQLLIESLLKLSQDSWDQNSLQPVDLSDVVSQALRNLTSETTKWHTPVTVDSLPTVYGNPTSLILVFQNLIENALKYNTSEQPHVRISANLDHRNRWVIALEDNGIGIEAKFLNCIFEPFRRLHSSRKYPGSGIGLATVKRVIEKHGWKIRAESNHGRGTTFYITVCPKTSQVRAKEESFSTDPIATLQPLCMKMNQ